MNKQDKFVTRFATWFIAPDGYVYVGSIIDDSEDAWKRRHEEMMKKPEWNGFKFLCTPIAVPVLDEVANKAIVGVGQ